MSILKLLFISNFLLIESESDTSITYLVRDKRHLTFSILHNWFKHLFNESINPNHDLGYWHNGHWSQNNDEQYYPISLPTLAPSLEPTIKPSLEPTIKPSLEPSLSPTLEPTIKPSLEPTIKPSFSTSEPSLSPTVNITSESESNYIKNNSIVSQSSQESSIDTNFIYLGAASVLFLIIFFIIIKKWKKNEVITVTDLPDDTTSNDNLNIELKIKPENIYLEPTLINSKKPDNLYGTEAYDYVEYDHLDINTDVKNDVVYEEIVLNKNEYEYDYEIAS